MIRWVLGLTFAIGAKVQADQQDRVCTELYRLSCAPGKYDDGTGVSQSNASYGETQIDLAKGLRAQAQQQFLAMVKSPPNNRLRELLLETTGLSLSSECKGAVDNPSEECAQNMALGAANLVMKSANPMLTGGSARYRGTFAAIDSLIGTDQFKEVKEALVQKARVVVNSGELAKRVEERIFPEVRALLVQKIEAYVPDPVQRKRMVDKVRDIHFDGTDCSSIQQAGGSTIDSQLQSNAFYDPQHNRFELCNGIGLEGTSEFQIASIVAHELSHSIDPCAVTVGSSDDAFKYGPGATQSQAEAQFPIPGVLQCLRSSQSVRAVRRQKGKFTGFCGFDDQITEAFADWMSAEILPDYLSSRHPDLTREQYRVGLSNIWRWACTMPDGQEDWDTHPETQLRSDNLLLMQPKLRQKMGCPPTVTGRTYCAPGGAPSAAEIKRRSRRKSEAVR